MWPNPQFPVDLVTFTEGILNEKSHFCAVYYFWYSVAQYPNINKDLKQWLLNLNKMLNHKRGKEILLVAELVVFDHNIKLRLKHNEIWNIICNAHDRILNPRKLKGMQNSKISNVNLMKIFWENWSLMSTNRRVCQYEM